MTLHLKGKLINQWKECHCQGSQIYETCPIHGKEEKKMKWSKSYYRNEWNCSHGVGHGNHAHGCDGCCHRKDYPGAKRPDGKEFGTHSEAELNAMIETVKTGIAVKPKNATPEICNCHWERDTIGSEVYNVAVSKSGKCPIHVLHPGHATLSKVEGCGICGGKLASIRGRYPHTDRRLICPTCSYERLEQIKDISDKNYGATSTSEGRKQNEK